MKNLKTQYQNITISGLPGAGSSTLGKSLAKILKWDYFSGGDFMRAYAIKKGLFNGQQKVHHDATVYSDEFDKKIDFGMRETLKTKKGKILDSWLSGFMAQDVSGVLKILVYCPEDAIRIDRLVNRDGLTVTQAKKHLFSRQEKNITKWRRIYQKEWQEWIVNKGIISSKKEIWFWYPKMYNLIINTFKNSREETLKIALQKLGLDYKIR